MRLISSAPTSAVTRRSPDCSAILLSPSCHVYGAGPGRPARAHALSASAVRAGQHVIRHRSCHLPVPISWPAWLLAVCAAGTAFSGGTELTLCDSIVTLDNSSRTAHTGCNGAQTPRTGNGGADFPVRCPHGELGSAA